VSNYIDEAHIEIITMNCLSDIGYGCPFRPYFSFDSLVFERKDLRSDYPYEMLRTMLENINPNITPDTEKLVEEDEV